jgi:hypothetical protein
MELSFWPFSGDVKEWLIVFLILGALAFLEEIFLPLFRNRLMWVSPSETDKTSAGSIRVFLPNPKKVE